MEDQRFAGHIAARRIGHSGRRGGGAGQHILPSLARIRQLLSGSAPALGTDRHIPPSGHAVNLRLFPALARVIAWRQQQQLYLIRHRAGRPRLGNHCAQIAAANHRLALGVAILQIAPAQPDHQRRGRFPSSILACRFARFRSARAHQNRTHRLSRVRAVRHQRLLLAIQHNQRPGNRVCLLPKPRMTPESCHTRCLMQLHLSRHRVRRTLPA